MIFLIAAAALCMGGIVAYLAREKGRSPLTWAIYGTVAAPIALPHILMVKPLDDDDGDVWAEIRDAIQTQSVNEQRPIMARSGNRPAADPQAGTTVHRQPTPAPQRREAPLRQPAAPSVSREVFSQDLNPAPKRDIKWEPQPGPTPEPTRAAVRPELTPEARPEPRPEARPDPRPDPRPEPRYEAEPVPRFEPKAEPRQEPKHDMVADKHNPPNPTQRTEPSFGPTTSSGGAPAGGSSQRSPANNFVLNASDRIGAPQTAYSGAAPAGDTRSRAPLSIDPDSERSEKRPIAGRLFAVGAVAVAIAAGFFVLGPTLARFVPPELAFWSQPVVKDVKSTVPAGITPPGSAPGAAPGVASNETLPGGNTAGDEAKEVGTARFGGPIKSDPKAPAYTGSSATPTDLAAATRGMKPVDVPEETKSAPKGETKSEAPKAAPKSEAPKAEPKAAAPAPKAEPKRVETAKAEPPKVEPKPEAPKAAPKPPAAATPAPKAEPKRVETAKAEPPKPVAPKAAPQAAPKPAPQEDFLSMVNKAIGTNSAPQPAAANSESEQIEQVSAANDLVQSVQVKLRERGYDPGTIDGRTNPKTVQAIREYQQSIGMPADGLIDVALMERLGVVGKRLQFPTAR